MGVQESIEASFKELLKTTPYKKLTVSALCEHSGVSRKSFYGRFRDKEDIVEWLFDKHAIDPIRTLNNLLSNDDLLRMEATLAERLYVDIYAEKEYYVDLVVPMRGNDDTFIRVVTNAIYRWNREVFPKIDKRSSLMRPEWKIDYAAYFFASSQAMLLQKWISEKMTIPPQEIAEFYQSITMAYWRSLSGG